jgi:hypothetical protein
MQFIGVSLQVEQFPAVDFPIKPYQRVPVRLDSEMWVYMMRLWEFIIMIIGILFNAASSFNGGRNDFSCMAAGVLIPTCEAFIISYPVHSENPNAPYRYPLYFSSSLLREILNSSCRYIKKSRHGSHASSHRVLQDHKGFSSHWAP